MVLTNIVVTLTNLLLSTYSVIIIINIILSWILPPNHSVRQFLEFLCAPILNPIRNLMRPLMAKSSIPLDFSPIIAIILIRMLNVLLVVLWQAIL